MTDPTITIAGLRARINSLLSAVQHSNRTTAERVTMFVEASSNADRLTAERDALAAQLAEVRAELSSDATKRDGRISAICRALDIDDDRDVVDAIDEMRSRHANDLASERAHLAACQTRIAGLEQAADERSAEVARLTARVAELEARPVVTVERFTEAYIKAKHGDHMWPADEAARAGLMAAFRSTFARLGPITLPAQDRAEELCRAYHERAADMDGHMVGRWQYHGPESQAICTEAMERALASLGAPPTSPPVTIDAGALYARCERDFMGGYSGQLYDAFKHGMWTVCNVLRSTKPTSPPAARPVFAGVSEDDLCVQMLMAADPSIDPGVALTMVNGVHRAKVRAVLTRLKTTLVAPVDLAAIERAVKAYHNASGEHAVPADALGTGQWRAAVLAMTDAFLAAGIPVTPEVNK